MGKVSTLSPLVEVRISYKAVYSLVYDNGHFHHAKSLVILGNLALIFQKWSEMLFGEGDVMDNLEVALHKGATITMGTSPKGTTYNHEGIGLPLLNGPTEFGETYPHCTLYTTDSKKECKVDDLIFCVRGSTTGRMNWADQTYSLGRGLCSIRGETLLDTKFIRCCIEWKLNELLNLAGGSTFPNLTKDTIRNFPIPYPKSRHKIAAVLSAYDDLIKNNTRRIEILEEMAQAIYREWFVEFRFPGHEGVEMVDSELGLIPQGWEVKKVKEIVKRLKAGQTYKQAKVKDTGKVIVVDQSRADFLGFHENKPDHDASPIDPIIIFGDHTCKMQLMITPFSLGPNVVPFIAKDEMPISYLFFGVSNLVETREYKRHWTELNNKEIAIGDPETREHFADFTSPIFEQIETLRQKNNNLRQTRDLLLLKLISGEIDVSEFDIDTD